MAIVTPPPRIGKATGSVTPTVRKTTKAKPCKSSKPVPATQMPIAPGLINR